MCVAGVGSVPSVRSRGRDGGPGSLALAGRHRTQHTGGQTAAATAPALALATPRTRPARPAGDPRHRGPHTDAHPARRIPQVTRGNTRTPRE